MRARKQIGRSEFYLWEISEVKNSSCAAVRCCVLAIVVTRTTGRQLNSNSVRCVARCASGPQMWRKVALTGVVSVVAPGSLVQIMAGSTISLIFCVMHARCWPYKDEANNRLKLGCEFALVVSFSCAALLRSVATKQALIDAGHLQPEAMTAQEQVMPTVLSTIVVVVCICLPGPSICRTERDQLLAAVPGYAPGVLGRLVIMCAPRSWHRDLQPQVRKTHQR